MEVSETGGVYWEAEQGDIVPPMVAASDSGASGRACVWMPGEIGAPGGSALACVTWRLRIPRAGAYTLWGRVRAPTPSDDSFYVRAFAGGEEPVGLSEWHTGAHARWEWTRVVLDQSKTPTPLVLPQGDVSLQLRVREDGTAIDRLFLSPSAQDRPSDAGDAVPGRGGAPDFDGDGRVDFSDFLLFARAFGSRAGDPAYVPAFDLDGNGSVEFSDFALFARAFGSGVAA